MLRVSRLGRGAFPNLTHLPNKLFINGSFVSAVSGKTFPVYNPATEEVITHVAEADAADVDLAVKAARAAFLTYRTTDGAHRRDLLLRLADLLSRHREEMAALESLDNGKPYRVALEVDVALAEGCLRYYAGFADKIYGEIAPVGGPSLSLIRHEPVGVCGQIIPWNFPLLMAAWKLGPALATGNAVVLKPAEQTPLSALRLAELIAEAGYPAGLVNVLSGFGATAGAALASHMDVRKIAFTGSTAVGREVMRRAAESNLKKISLELGGKSALIVCPDADVEEAVATASQGIYFNMGQVCTASSRLFVHESLYETFVQRLKAHAESRRVGPGNDPANHQGPLVSQRQHERVLDYIEDGRRAGATVVTGGHRVGTKGYFVQPTVFTDVTPAMRICQEEIFGPVACVLPYRHLEEAVDQANASCYGLAAGLCTRSLDTALRYSSFLEAGTVWVNGWNVFDVAQPFGGFKESGLGRELGRQALDLYTETKTVHIALKGPLVKN